MNMISESSSTSLNSEVRAQFTEQVFEKDGEYIAVFHYAIHVLDSGAKMSGSVSSPDVVPFSSEEDALAWMADLEDKLLDNPDNLRVADWAGTFEIPEGEWF